MDIAEIRRLIKLVENSKLSELEIVEGDQRIRLVKLAENDGAFRPFFPMNMQMQTALPNDTIPITTARIAPVAQPAVSTKFVEMTSPMVGTFYRAPSPEAPPYVQIGDIVKPDQVLCIIEAMKLMNEIEAETAGRIVEIAVENAQAVEFGQLLFRIEPL